MATFDPLGLNVKIEQDRWDRAGQQAAAYEQGVIAEIEALNRRILAQQKMMAQQKKGRGADPASETRSVSSSVTTKSGGKKKKALKALTETEEQAVFKILQDMIMGMDETDEGALRALNNILSSKYEDDDYDYQAVLDEVYNQLQLADQNLPDGIPKNKTVAQVLDDLQKSNFLKGISGSIGDAEMDAVFRGTVEDSTATGETRSVTSKSTREVPTERAKQIRAARDTDEWRALHAALENDGIIQEAEEAAWAEANPGSKTLKQMLIDDFIEDTMLTSLADSADLRASIARDREKLRELESKSISSADSVEERTQRGMVGQWKAYEAMTGNDRVRANAAIRAASGRWTPRPKGVSEKAAEDGVRLLSNLRGGKLVEGAQRIANGLFSKDREKADGLMAHLLERVSKKLGDERKQAQPTTEQALQEIDMSGVSYDIQSGQGQIDKAAEEKREAERRAEEARRRRAAEARRRREAELARQAELEALQEGGYSFPGFGTGEMLEQEAGSYSFPGFGTGEMLEDSSVKSQRSTPKAQPRPAETQETIPYRLVPAIPGAERFAEFMDTPRSEGDYWHRNYGVPPLRPTESGPAPAAAAAPAPAAPYVISDAATAANFQSWQDRPSGVGIDPRLPPLERRAAPSAPIQRAPRGGYTDVEQGAAVDPRMQFAPAPAPASAPVQQVSMVPAPVPQAPSYQSPYEIGSGEMLYAPPAPAPANIGTAEMEVLEMQPPTYQADFEPTLVAAPLQGVTRVQETGRRRETIPWAGYAEEARRGPSDEEMMVRYGGRVSPGSEIDKVARAGDVIEQNQNVPFIQRITHADRFPVLENDDGSVSTHLLATAGGGPGEPVFVYPELQLINERWVKDKNPDVALQRGNVVYFDSLQEAEDFAQGSWKPYAGQGVRQVEGRVPRGVDQYDSQLPSTGFADFEPARVTGSPQGVTRVQETGRRYESSLEGKTMADYAKEEAGRGLSDLDMMITYGEPPAAARALLAKYYQAIEQVSPLYRDYLNEGYYLEGLKLKEKGVQTPELDELLLVTTRDMNKRVK